MSRGEGSDIGNIIVGIVICEWALKVVGRKGRYKLDHVKSCWGECDELTVYKLLTG
jgi:hypothetical protein